MKPRSIFHPTLMWQLPLVLVMGCPAVAIAARPSVSSGDLLRQNPRALPGREAAGHDASQRAHDASTPAASPEELAFLVKSFVFDGLLSASEQARVDDLTAPLKGRMATFSQLRKLRAELTAALYQDEETLVRVDLPAQTVRDGVVRFEIVRGRIEELRIRNQSGVATKYLAPLLRRGGHPHSLRSIEKGVTLVGQLPGVGTVRPVLSAGASAGGTVVTVDVGAGKRLYGALSVDNTGSRSAGWRRLGGLAGINNPLGHGDRLELLAFATPSDLQTDRDHGGRTQLARLSYETLFGLGASRIGVALTRVAYRLGGIFDGLGKGSANEDSVYATIPLRRSQGGALDAGASVDFKSLRDSRFDDLLVSRAHGVLASARVGGWFSGELAGRRNMTQFDASLSHGSFSRHELDHSVGASVSATHRFVRLAPSVTLMQSLSERSYVTAQLQGQWADRRLDSTSRLGLGGPVAVRAYDQGAVAVDEGFIASLGATTSPWKRSNVSLSAFYDYAKGRLQRDAHAPDETSTLQGYGVGLGYARSGISTQLSYARRVGMAYPGAAAYQLWMNLGWSF